ncbi:hypothetical protein [Streptomyces buecherae]|uniref:hypothetical protein n=1 Tax=Streptomyces buecherae TaxID=2763006 RepID=UPI00365FB596
MTQSMGRVGSCFNSAANEACNSVLKAEYVHRHAFRTRAEARIKIEIGLSTGGSAGMTSTLDPVRRINNSDRT